MQLIGGLETPDLEASDTAFVSLVTAEGHIGVLIGLVRGDHQEICLSKDDAQELVHAIRLATNEAGHGSTTVRTRDPEESRDAAITIAFATDRIGINVSVIDEGYVQLWVSKDGARAIASALEAAIAGVPL